ncbi:ADP-ribosylglycohydrolase family protein [Candidatus Uabimicrobium amorphum]|uniref:Hydrolase n=1 Tax=Uabimicrobium amorphum TaxID=2596890 RepID=A0A5S9ILB5_UABAM|nr:ADP-ribosylglycohydrolase family protein [Candidatus Uabimicrobium amorphum]BBM83989.1 hydrolase [Candidatus Uabimicrobium amorphum]
MTSKNSIDILSRAKGCLLGLTVGDALGARFEGQAAYWITRKYKSPQQLIDNPPTKEIYYTDDAQMMIGIAEALCQDGCIEEKTLCQKFVNNYVPSRGYARGARKVLKAMEKGQDYRKIASSYFKGGSFGNGGAMRVAPIGLFFYQDLQKVMENARLSSLPTHTHPLGIEGTQLLAIAVALATSMEKWDKELFYEKLFAHCQSPEYRAQLEKAQKLEDCSELATVGNAITALESVPTAIASFALNPHSFTDTIGHSILIGGDTDTVAAMAGSISGAFLGVEAIPQNLLDALENEGKGRDYITELAEKMVGKMQ